MSTDFKGRIEIEGAEQAAQKITHVNRETRELGGAFGRTTMSISAFASAGHMLKGAMQGNVQAMVGLTASVGMLARSLMSISPILRIVAIAGGLLAIFGNQIKDAFTSAETKAANLRKKLEELGVVLPATEAITRAYRDQAETIDRLAQRVDRLTAAHRAARDAARALADAERAFSMNRLDAKERLALAQESDPVRQAEIKRDFAERRHGSQVNLANVEYSRAEEEFQRSKEDLQLEGKRIADDTRNAEKAARDAEANYRQEMRRSLGINPALHSTKDLSDFDLALPEFNGEIPPEVIKARDAFRDALRERDQKRQDARTFTESADDRMREMQNRARAAKVIQQDAISRADEDLAISTTGLDEPQKAKARADRQEELADAVRDAEEYEAKRAAIHALYQDKIDAERDEARRRNHERDLAFELRTLDQAEQRRKEAEDDKSKAASDKAKREKIASLEQWASGISSDWSDWVKDRAASGGGKSNAFHGMTGSSRSWFRDARGVLRMSAGAGMGSKFDKSVVTRSREEELALEANSILKQIRDRVGLAK